MLSPEHPSPQTAIQSPQMDIFITDTTAQSSSREITVLVYNHANGSLHEKGTSPDGETGPSDFPTESRPTQSRVTIFVGRVIQGFSRIGANRPV